MKKQQKKRQQKKQIRKNQRKQIEKEHHGQIEKNENFFKKHYSLSWRYICESKGCLLFIVLVLLFGFSVALYYQPTEVIEMIKEFIERLLEETQGLSMWEMVVYILNNNLKNSFFAMILGVFFGVVPFLTAFVNGYVLGFVVEKITNAEGISILWKLAPHGIFEFPAVILALALGTKIGLFWFAKEKKKEFVGRLENSLRVFLFVILPLLVIAAIIEGFLIFVLG